MARLSNLLRVRSGDERVTALVVSLMFVTMSGLTIGESGIEGLFFERVGPSSLPMMYVLQALTAFVAMLTVTGCLAKLGPRRTISARRWVCAA